MRPSGLSKMIAPSLVGDRPGIVGTSAGASLGAIIALSLPIQIEWLGYSIVSLAAFVGVDVAGS